MVTYKQIIYFMENELGFKFKTHYKPTILNFLRPAHVAEPRIKEILGPAVEIPKSAICSKKLAEAISQTS